MKHLDTFSGLGGWALAARWMSWHTQAFVEKDKFCQAVLAKNFAGVPIHDDIFTFSGEPFRGIDILTGSTPCQPFSQAGKRQGSNDERHLFPEFLRVVEECQPRWIVIENVYGLLNIESGRVFEAYNTSLEGQGYTVQTLCIPASALNAPHRRDRLWIIAQSNSIGKRARHREVQTTNGEISQRDDDAQSGNTDFCVARGIVTNADEKCECGLPKRTAKEHARHCGRNRGDEWNRNWTEVATELCGMDARLSAGVDRPKLSASKHRENRLKALGNGIVPQIAYEIFQAIQEIDNESA